MPKGSLGWTHGAGYGYGYSSLFFGLGGGQYGGSYLRATQAEPGARALRFPSDEALRREIATTLARFPNLDRETLQVSVWEGEVALRGAVSSHETLKRVQESVENLRGVRAVDTSDLFVLPVESSQAAG